MIAKCQLAVLNKENKHDSILLVYGSKIEVLVTIWKHIKLLFINDETKFIRMEPKVLQIFDSGEDDVRIK